jgi:hypothetical protein
MYRYRQHMRQKLKQFMTISKLFAPEWQTVLFCMLILMACKTGHESPVVERPAKINKPNYYAQ